MRHTAARSLAPAGPAALIALAVLAAACGSPAGSAPSGPGSPAPTPGPSALIASLAPSDPIGPGTVIPSAAPETAAPETAAPETAALETLAAPSPAGSVLEDPELLALLPADLGGVPVVLEPLAFAEAAGDPAFASKVDAAAFGVVVDGEDLSSAVVAQLVPGTFSEAFFRDWRDSYDEGACGQAGGVAATAETELAGRSVYITTCAGGLRTYHAWVEERGAVVSAISLGERRFGEQLMAGLRP